MATHTCGICESDRASVINAFLSSGRSAHWIEGQMRELGAPTKAETVRRHLSRCLAGQTSHAALVDGSATPADFADAVRAEANRMLAAGKLTIRTEHGLQAQALLDRRAEKQADRRLMVELAGLLSGARRIEGPPQDLIEAEWVEVGDEESDGLAPLALVSGE